MSDFNARSICILGRQPVLGLAELESLYGAEHLEPLGPHAAQLDIEASDINFTRLGGTIKVAKILDRLPGTSWAAIEAYLIKNIPEHSANLPDGKLTLGLSAYGLNVQPETINKTALKIKRRVRQSGRPIRIVPNKETALSSAQVLHNSLTRRGGWELLLIAASGQTVLAQSLFIQDIEAYGARDQARPMRDARVGMLPPKLAQITINLATGKIEPPVISHQSSVKKLATTKAPLLLDPFCGTGVILQEALLMGYNVLGTDLESKMVEYSKANLDWLKTRYPNIGDYQVQAGDATDYQWPKTVSAVASEVYLGRPLNALPASAKLREIVSDVNTIIEKFLKNLALQLAPGTPVSLAVPAWRGSNGQTTHLPLIDRIRDLGYNRNDFKKVRSADLIYFRAGQTVARQLLVLVKR